MHGRPRCDTSHRTLRARHDRQALGARLRTLLGFLVRAALAAAPVGPGTPATPAAPTGTSTSVAIVCMCVWVWNGTEKECCELWPVVVRRQGAVVSFG